MAFPVVEATNTSIQDGRDTSHTIQLPSGISAGDLLLIVINVEAFFGNETISGLSEYTLLRRINGSHGDNNLHIYYKEATGSEGSTQGFTTSVSRESQHHSYRISGWGTIEGSTGATGASGEPDPDSLTPSGGAADYLWIATGSSALESISGATAPSNYGNLLANTAGLSSLLSARRNLNASSEDPGAFDLSVSSAWAGATVAVGPEAGETPVDQTITVPTQHSAEITKTTSTPTAHFQAGEAPHTVEASHFQTVGSPKTVRTHHFQEIAQILQIPTYHRAAAPISNPPPMGGRRGPGRWAGVIARRGRRK